MIKTEQAPITGLENSKELSSQMIYFMRWVESGASFARERQASHLPFARRASLNGSMGNSGKSTTMARLTTPKCWPRTSRRWAGSSLERKDSKFL